MGIISIVSPFGKRMINLQSFIILTILSMNHELKCGKDMDW